MCFVCVSVWVCAHEGSEDRGQKKIVAHRKLELQAVVELPDVGAGN